METVVQEATAERWSDIAQVMGANGAYGGCWCTFWRLTNQQLPGRTAEDNRATLQAAVSSEQPAGLILYADGEPVGWCSVAPRLTFPRLFHTKGISIDDPEDTSVWSVVCIYVRKEYRRLGVSSKLLGAAIDYARQHGAAVIEGYPVVDPSHGKRVGLATGTIGLFTRGGFSMQEQEPSGRRVVMRLML